MSMVNSNSRTINNNSNNKLQRKNTVLPDLVEYDSRKQQPSSLNEKSFIAIFTSLKKLTISVFGVKISIVQIVRPTSTQLDDLIEFTLIADTTTRRPLEITLDEFLNKMLNQENGQSFSQLVGPITGNQVEVFCERQKFIVSFICWLVQTFYLCVIVVYSLSRSS